MAVWVGNGLNEGATGEIGVSNCGGNEVLVEDGAERMVGVELATLIGGKDVGIITVGAGVFVRGCKRYDPVIAIAVLVLLAFTTAASLAGPPEAIQTRIIKPMNRPVMPSACK